jgi:hypothetical protein
VESMPSNRRHDAKRDQSELPIVHALEQAGCKVYRKLPCDLLVRLPRDPPGVLRILEVKTPTKAGKLRLNKSQAQQAKFVSDTGCPYVVNAEQALQALGLVSDWPVTMTTTVHASAHVFKGKL